MVNEEGSHSGLLRASGRRANRSAPEVVLRLAPRVFNNPARSLGLCLVLLAPTGAACCSECLTLKKPHDSRDGGPPALALLDAGFLPDHEVLAPDLHIMSSSCR
jgi:hypothetical protein